MASSSSRGTPSTFIRYSEEFAKLLVLRFVVKRVRSGPGEAVEVSLRQRRERHDFEMRASSQSPLKAILNSGVIRSTTSRASSLTYGTKRDISSRRFFLCPLKLSRLEGMKSRQRYNKFDSNSLETELDPVGEASALHLVNAI